jgi:hypothetical protein
VPLLNTVPAVEKGPDLHLGLNAEFRVRLETLVDPNCSHLLLVAKAAVEMGQFFSSPSWPIEDRRRCKVSLVH